MIVWEVLTVQMIPLTPPLPSHFTIPLKGPKLEIFVARIFYSNQSRQSLNCFSAVGDSAYNFLALLPTAFKTFKSCRLEIGDKIKNREKEKDMEK